MLIGDELLVFVFGPGYGESIVVYVPDGHWLVVDSLRKQTHDGDTNPALDLLAAHRVYADAVVLTHPHGDHVRGLAQILERRKVDSPVGCLPSAFLPEPRSSPDAQLVLDEGSRQAALGAIQRIWNEQPDSRWPLKVGERRTLGGAAMEVLAPERIPTMVPSDWNRWSSPLHLSWHGCSITLGADLTVPGWNRVAGTTSVGDQVSDAALLKASHHASRNAQHRVAIGDPPPVGRPAIVTPFNKGAQLPSYASGEGVDLLLRTHERVTVTAAPAAARGRTATRASVRPRIAGFGPLTLEYEVSPLPPEQSWACAAFDRTGQLAGEYLGPSAGYVSA